MSYKYKLSTKNLEVLKVLRDGLVELPASQIAVHTRLLPKEVHRSMRRLQNLGLAKSGRPISGYIREPMFGLSRKGKRILKVLTHYQDKLPVGTIVTIPSRIPTLSWLSGHGIANGSVVEIAEDDSDD